MSNRICIRVEQVAAEQKRGLLSRPVDLLLSLMLLGAMAFTVFRGFVSNHTGTHISQLVLSESTHA